MEALSVDDALRCVVLRGAGTRAFSAGADITAFPVERGSREREEEYAHGAGRQHAVDPRCAGIRWLQ